MRVSSLWALHSCRCRDPSYLFSLEGIHPRQNLFQLPINPLTWRVLIGIGAGIGVCVGPVYLAEIAPPKIKGTVGALSGFILNFIPLNSASL